MICPSCHGALFEDAEAWQCARCPRSFPSHRGIPDLRLAADAYLGVLRDRERAGLIADALPRHDFPGLLEYYWSLSEETPRALRRRFVASARRAQARAADLLDRLIREGHAAPGSRVLEVGCGTAGFLVEAAGRVGEVIGLDIALRWLQVGRRRLLDAGRADLQLVCAGAEALPFPDHRFDLVVCIATLEFTADPKRALLEFRRVLRPGGALFVNSVNRFSLAGEPHVGLWGVGFLPRAWQARYVRLRRRGDFAGLRLLSYPELRRLVGCAFRQARIEPATLPGGVVAELAAGRRLAVRGYERLRNRRPFRSLLRWLGPEWDVLLTRD